jgi:glycosyltransferase involved in cell wall biosynthesis
VDVPTLRHPCSSLDATNATEPGLILTAWALATPVVATRLAVRGLICEHSQNLLIAKSPGEFSSAVTALLEDRERRERIGAAGRTHVMRHYSWEASRAKFEGSKSAGVEDLVAGG